MRVSCEVAIVGAGFGGSLTALVLNRLGRRCVLIDRGRHPRYAIGESSTPVADLVLHDLAQTYDLPRLAPLAKYGTWRATYPELTCGLKRGFSYFRHSPGEAFAPRADHANELLVTASSDDRRADTHWFRPEVDAFLAEEVQAAGIPYFDQTELRIARQEPTWALDGTRGGRPIRIEAAFLIDASGEGAFLPRALGLENRAQELQTRSWSVFGHFAGVRLWREVLEELGVATEDHPFDCDRAAVQQVLDEGWMWQLRFDNDVLSAGFVLAGDPPSDADPQALWNGLMERYPSLARQFAAARLVLPPEGLRRTRRLQRRTSAAVGENWALLPYTAGFIDALHSTGIAQTLCAIERLAVLFAEHGGRPSQSAALRRYERTVFAEIAMIDQLVHGGYLTRDRFPMFTAFVMLYFAAATTYERRRAAGEIRPGAAFLCAEDPQWRAVVDRVYQQVRQMSPSDRGSEAAFHQFVAEAIAPYNTAGLCDAAAHNMYRYTAAPKAG